MSNVVEFVMSLKDLMSSGMMKIASQAQKSMSVTQGAVNGVGKAITSVGASATGVMRKMYTGALHAAKGQSFLSNSVNELEDRLQEVNRIRFGTVLRSEFASATREAERLERQISRLRNSSGTGGIVGRIEDWRNDFMQSLPGGRLLSNPILLAGGAIGGIAKMTQTAMTADMEKMQLQVLTDDQTGKALYDQLTQFATDTVFGSEVYKQAADMIGAGIEAGEVMPAMKMLGDISMGSADKLNRLSYAFAQVKGAGKLMGQDLLQLQNAGFYPLQVIAEKTGESMTQVKDRMGKGLISFQEVYEAMQTATGEGGKFHNMLDRIAKTPYGQLENFKGMLGQMAIEMGNVFLPIAAKLIGSLSWVGEKLGPFLKPVIAIVGGLAVGIMAVAAAQWVWNAAQLANPITWIIGGVVALIALISYLIMNITGWGKAWDHTLKAGKYLFWAYVESIKWYWNTMVDGLMIGLNKIKEGWYKFKISVGIGNRDESRKMLEQIHADTERRKSEIKNGRLNVGELAKKAGSEMFAAWNSFSWEGKSLKDVSDNIKDRIGLGDSTAYTPELSKEIGSGITSSGPRQITINIQKEMIGQLSVNSINLREGLGEVESLVKELMYRTLISLKTA